MSEEKVLFEDHGNVAVIKINRPDSRNALDSETVLLINKCTEQAKDKKYRAVVLTGAGSAFCAGADLREFADPDKLGTWESVQDSLHNGYHVGLGNLIKMDKPVLAAVEGPCAGIGCAFLLSCDVVVMGKSSFFQVGFSKIGLIPDGGTNWLLTRAVGYQKAFRMAAEAQRVNADECVEIGLCSEIAEDGKVLEETMKLAQQYADFSPSAIAKTKHLMRDSFDRSYLQNLDVEADTQAGCVGSNDNVEGVTAFIEKRKPNFPGE